jgi:hypothetical protein
MSGEDMEVDRTTWCAVDMDNDNEDLVTRAARAILRT